ncbi:MAG: NAD-dependent epimerase/dehydratase family protein [Nanoarchaeota archaeon]|nr:NAD-dependent epimerase/dehydratase family protein [Nanoarchaeota archaeon]MBU0977071.1 NAD-dependent epimerase/dehydratase family protein [Nanoarchaeota archaeon]
MEYEKENKKDIRRVLVTGGAGYIGSCLVALLLERGYKVRILDNFVFGRESLKNLEKNKNLQIFEGDIRNIEDLDESMEGVDAVVHLAGLVGMKHCKTHERAALQVNKLATNTLVDVCNVNKVKRIIFASTCSVYGSSTGTLDENSPTNPLESYAQSKLDSEKIILKRADKNICPTVLRFGTVFGPSRRMRFDLVANVLVAKALHEGKISIFGGSQWRPLVHTEDIARAILAVIEADEQKVNGQVFNVGGNKNNFQIKELGEKIKENFKDVVISFESIDDNRDYKVSFDKIEKTLGFVPIYGIEEGVEQMKHLLQDEISDYKDEIYYNVAYKYR